MLKATALVLAAGYSRRFGSDKKMAILDNGNRMISQTIENIARSKLDYRIVIKPSDSDLLGRLFDPTTFIIAKHSAKGMGQSITEGLLAIADDYPACLICLADMPYILPATYQRIAESIDGYDAVLPFYQGTQGNPVAIAKSLYPQFLQLNGDSGGKAIIQSSGVKRYPLHTDDHGILRDIDLPADINR
ncbi:nucleotidyltransferase family protein [Oceanicoccus sagamiensis]|uniref:MobA-like NTP transferase domain-containing protein n=1 Tax=Oceanicoccus sagamiensis TaxID=716816 RepID=A0A1X9NCI4_9GAMM|nr:nucleotidyltransferase family protein [Oceanicoccus sagamiensis]ARN75738.1 hypothetical protein BST96_17470 [Oceanicoccus sagamiensis]